MFGNWYSKGGGVRQATSFLLPSHTGGFKEKIELKFLYKKRKNGHKIVWFSIYISQDKNKIRQD